MAIDFEIDKNLILCTSDDLPDELIGAAVFVNTDKFAQHAGIFIRYKGENKLFHYDGAEVKIDDFIDGEWYFFKELTIIDRILVPSILNHCRLVKKTANPKYGYFYIGSMYDDSGDFNSPGKMPEYMTCVGFCLNFIKYCLKGKDFFKYTDWDSSTVSKQFVDSFISKVKLIHPEIKTEDFIKGLRRIFPLEYITGAFYDDKPVLKKFTDENSPKIQSALENKMSA